MATILPGRLTGKIEQTVLAVLSPVYKNEYLVVKICMWWPRRGYRSSAVTWSILMNDDRNDIWWRISWTLSWNRWRRLTIQCEVSESYTWPWLTGNILVSCGHVFANSLSLLAAAALRRPTGIWIHPSLSSGRLRHAKLFPSINLIEQDHRTNLHIHKLSVRLSQDSQHLHSSSGSIFFIHAPIEPLSPGYQLRSKKK